LLKRAAALDSFLRSVISLDGLWGAFFRGHIDPIASTPGDNDKLHHAENRISGGQPPRITQCVVRRRLVNGEAMLIRMTNWRGADL